MSAQALAWPPTLLPGGLDQQAAHMRVAGLGDRALATRGARGALGGGQAEEGGQAAPTEALPVADLDGERESRERRDAAQAGEAVVDLCPGLRGRLHGDGGVEGVAAIAHGEHRRQGLLIGDLQRPLGKTLPGEPELMRLRPGALLPDEATTQEQLGESVTGAHQVAAGVLAGAHQVAGRLLGKARHAHRDELLEAQQAGQPDGVAAVGLDAIARCARDARGRRYQAGHAGGEEGTRQLVAGRPGLIGDRRRRLRADPGDQRFGGHGHGQALHLTREPVEHSRLDRTGVHVKADERTLMHSGASSRPRPAVALLATATRARLCAEASGSSIWSSPLKAILNARAAQMGPTTKRWGLATKENAGKASIYVSVQFPRRRAQLS